MLILQKSLVLKCTLILNLKDYVSHLAPNCNINLLEIKYHFLIPLSPYNPDKTQAGAVWQSNNISRKNPLHVVKGKSS